MYEYSVEYIFLYKFKKVFASVKEEKLSSILLGSEGGNLQIKLVKDRLAR